MSWARSNNLNAFFLFAFLFFLLLRYRKRMCGPTHSGRWWRLSFGRDHFFFFLSGNVTRVLWKGLNVRGLANAIREPFFSVQERGLVRSLELRCIHRHRYRCDHRDLLCESAFMTTLKNGGGHLLCLGFILFRILNVEKNLWEL